MQVNVISDTVQEFNGERFYLCGFYFQHSGKRLHRAVWKYHNGEIPKGYHIHHKDENRSNNSIENLEMIKGSEHLALHGAEEKNKVNARKNMHKAMECAKEWHGTKEGFAFHSKLSKETWAKREMQTYNCSFCGKEFQTKKIYGANMNHFCHPNCKARFRTKRLRDECKANQLCGQS